jgi:hypothetical protein
MQLPGGGGHSRYSEVEGTMLQALCALWQAMLRVRATGRGLDQVLNGISVWTRAATEEWLAAGAGCDWPAIGVDGRRKTQV